jgi:hypothetical protein
MTYSYDSLHLYLKGHSAPSTTLSFRSIEKILGRPLPPDAEALVGWWTNEVSQSPGNVQCLA